MDSVGSNGFDIFWLLLSNRFAFYLMRSTTSLTLSAKVIFYNLSYGKVIFLIKYLYNDFWLSSIISTISS